MHRRRKEQSKQFCSQRRCVVDALRAAVGGGHGVGRTRSNRVTFIRPGRQGPTQSEWQGPRGAFDGLSQPSALIGVPEAHDWPGSNVKRVWLSRVNSAPANNVAPRVRNGHIKDRMASFKSDVVIVALDKRTSPAVTGTVRDGLPDGGGCQSSPHLAPGISTPKTLQ